MHAFSVNIVYFVKLSLCQKMFTETSFLSLIFSNNDVLSVAVAFQGNMPIVFVHCIIFIMWVHSSATWIGRCIQYAVLAIQIIWAILILSHFVSFPHVLRLSVAIFLFSLDLFSQFFVVNELRWRMSYVYDNLKRSTILLPEPHELKHRRKKEKFMKSHLMPHDEFQLFIENVLYSGFIISVQVLYGCHKNRCRLHVQRTEHVEWERQMRFESDGEKNRSNFLLKQ